MSPPPSAAVVELSGPLDLAASLEPLRRHGDDRIDRWDGETLRRTVPRRGGGAVAWAGRLLDSSPSGAVRLAVEVASAADLPVAVEAARTSTLAAPVALAALAARDPVVAELARRHAGVAQLRTPGLYAALVRAISAQQVNLRWAATTRARLAEAVGERHRVAGGEVWSLDPAAVAGTAVATLRGLQFTTRKAEYLVGCAAAVASGELDADALGQLPDAEVVARLTSVRGIGRWTAEWLLARTFGRAVVVAGDLGVRKVVARAYLGVPIAAEAEVRAATAHWGAAATAAQWLLLHAGAAGEDLVALGRRARALDGAG